MFTPLLLAHVDDNDIGALVFAIPIVAIVCTFFHKSLKTIVESRNNRGGDPAGGWGPYRRWRSGPRNGAFPEAPTGGLTAEEQAVLLKLQQTLAQMERRIESLETILIDQTRTHEKYGTKH